MSNEIQPVDNNQTQSNEISLQIADLVRKSDSVNLRFKLDGNNYPLWVRLMKVAIGSRGKSNHITVRPPPPAITDNKFDQWEENDLTVFSWIIQNMDNKLVTSFAQHQTSKALWESLAVTYGTRTADPFQIYDLGVRANKVSQAQKTLEDYWSSLQALWLAIDQREPCPLDCLRKGVNQYRRLISNRRLYQFLSGLDNKFEGIRRDILKETPVTTAEVAFAKVRREAAWSQILQPTTNENHLDSEIGTGLATHAPTRLDGQHKPQRGNRSRPKPQTRSKEDKMKLVCTHCGMHKHTKDQCFQLVGRSGGRTTTRLQLQRGRRPSDKEEREVSSVIPAQLW